MRVEKGRGADKLKGQDYVLHFLDQKKKHFLSKTNKGESTKGKQSLLTDVSAPCICYYFSCQGFLQRLSHCLADVILTVIMFVFVGQVGLSFWSNR